MVRKIHFPFLCVLLSLLLSCSKDSSYNFDALRDMDKEATLFGDGLSITMNENKIFLLKDCLAPSGFLTIDESGLYKINGKGDLFKSDVTVPGVSGTKSEIFGIDIPDVTVKLPLPKSFREDSKIIISNPQLTFIIGNPFNAEASFSAKVTAKGSVNEEESVNVSGTVSPSGETSLTFGRTNCEGIEKLISMLPEELVFSDIKMSYEESAVSKIPVGTKGCLTVSYSVDAPLLLDEGSRFRFTSRMDMNLESAKMGKSRIAIDASFINLLEMEVHIGISICVNDKLIEIPLPVVLPPAGGAQEEVVETIEIPELDEEIRKISYIQYNVNMYSLYNGAPVSAQQGVKVHICRISLPEGLDMIL